MSCRVEEVGQLTYQFCPESVPPAADRLQAVLKAQLIDELTGDPVGVDVKLTTSVDGLFPRVARGGLIGLVGQPARLFPTLNINPVNVNMRATVPGYLPLDLGGMLGPIAGFPDQFTPLDLGDIGLHRASTTLRGRTLRRASLIPIVVTGATVEIAGYWPNFPPVNIDPITVLQAPNLLALAPPLYAFRPAGLTQLQRRDVVPVIGQEKTLLLPASSGGTRLRLSDRIGLAAGVLLIVDHSNPTHLERILIAAVDTTSTSDQPAWVTLSHPLAYTHLEGITCQPANLLLPAASNSLIRAAIPGDETVFLNGMAGLISGATVELDDGGGAPEYHEAGFYQDVSDADGYFRLPPIARVAMIALHAEKLSLTSSSDERFTPDYRLAEEHLTVMFP
jgi:hypothetical protein